MRTEKRPTWQWVASLMVIVFMLVGTGSVQAAVKSEVDPPPPPPPDAPIVGELPSKGEIPTLSSALEDLQNEWEIDPDEAISSAGIQGLDLEDFRVKVMITVATEQSVDDIYDAVLDVGGEVIAEYKQWIDAWVPIAHLEEIAVLPDVQFVEKAIPVMPLDEPVRESANMALAGTYLTQGVAASNADDWHAVGYTGSGVDIAILDSFEDYTLAQTAGELPSSITVYGTLYLGSPHGTAVAEIIHDMAPDADLTFASPGSATEMAAQIVALAQAGNEIISSSIGFYNAEPGDGTGPVADAVTTAHNTYDTLYVQAGGNQANYHWDGNFVSTGGLYHEFDSGVFVNQLGLLPVGIGLQEHLRWNAWPTTDQNYDLLLVRYGDCDDDPGTDDAWCIIWGSYNSQTGSQPPTEEFYYVTDVQGYYGLAIRNTSATGNHVMDLMGHNSPGYQYNVSDRSLVDPATSPYAFSVAALDSTSPYPLESYSSHGPTHGPGGTLTGGANKPRISGYANVDTWSYGPEVFNGTSSATPHVAGAAALVGSRYPSYAADDIMSYLESNADDMGTPGYDLLYGAGRLVLPDPCYTLTLSHTGSGANPTANPTNSSGCPVGEYIAGATINLTAAPAVGWQVAGWSGTDNDSSQETTNSLTMSDNAHNASVTYEEIPPSEDLALNRSFEVYVPNWYRAREVTANDGADEAVVHTGDRSLRIEANGDSKSYTMPLAESGSAGDSFNFSYWARGQDIGAGPFNVRVTLLHSDGSSEHHYLRPDVGSYNWAQKTMVFSAAEDYDRILVVIIYGKSQGTLWLDDLSLLRDGSEDLALNRSFEVYVPNWYRAREVTANDGADEAVVHTGDRSLRIEANGDSKSYTMPLAESGSAGDSFNFSYWARGQDIGAGPFNVRVTLLHSDGSSEHHYLRPDVGSYNWAQKTMVFSAAEDYDRILVVIIYGKSQGTLWLDDLSLLRAS